MKKIMRLAVLVSATLGLNSCVESVSSSRYYGSGYYVGYTGNTPPYGCNGSNYGAGGCRHANWYGSGAYYRPGYTGGVDHKL